MGKVSAAMAFTEAGADVTIQSDFHHPPRQLVVPVPYFVELEGFRADTEARRDGNRIMLSPETQRLTLRWRTKPDVHRGTCQSLLRAFRREASAEIVDGKIVYHKPEQVSLTEAEEQYPPTPLSFELVVEAYRQEYQRRFHEYVANGGKPYPVTGPCRSSSSSRS